MAWDLLSVRARTSALTLMMTGFGGSRRRIQGEKVFSVGSVVGPGLAADRRRVRDSQRRGGRKKFGRAGSQGVPDRQHCCGQIWACGITGLCSGLRD